MGAPLTGFGPRASVGVGVSLAPPLTLGIEVGLHEIKAGEVVPSEDGSVAPYERELHLWQQSLVATWRRDRLAISGGLSYTRAVGRLRLGDLIDCDEQACDATGSVDPAAQPVSVNFGAAGPMLGLGYSVWERERVRLAPALQAGAWSDLDRWYPWAALSLTMGFGR